MAARTNGITPKDILHAAAVAVPVLLVLAGPTWAQSGGGSQVGAQSPSATTPTTDAAASPAPAPSASSGTREWSGESGSSGHPLMKADAIRLAAANFPACLERLWPLAARRGVTRESYQRLTAGLTPDLRIMDLMDAQPEFTKAVWDYLDLLVNDAKIERGREMLAQYAQAFAAAEKAYGVDRYIIAAIWGVEFELRNGGRRATGAAVHGNARLHRPAPRLFSRRVPGGG